MKVGDLVQYKHNFETGVVIDINPSRAGEDTHLIYWSKEKSSRRIWYVDPDWIEANITCNFGNNKV